MKTIATRGQGIKKRKKNYSTSLFISIFWFPKCVWRNDWRKWIDVRGCAEVKRKDGAITNLSSKKDDFVISKFLIPNNGGGPPRNVWHNGI